MRKENKGKGLLALLGVIGGALAIWKYKSLSPAQKADLKDQIATAGDQVMDKVKEVWSDTQSGANQTYKDLKRATGKV